MNTQQPDELNQVRDIIWEIEDKSASGAYIFRGEPEQYEESPYYGKVSSTLYRHYKVTVAMGHDFDIEQVQMEMLVEAKKHLREQLTEATEHLNTAARDFEILTTLQHYGGKTNLIDFTTDYLIALFFACAGSYSKDGRIILRKKADTEDLVEKPSEPSKPLNRVIAQKSIFVRPHRGFIEFDQNKDVVEIPAELKEPMLDYLRKYHNISEQTIYNDLHGFIRIQHIHHRAYEEFYSALVWGEIGKKAWTPDQKQMYSRKEIEHYTKALELNPQMSSAYYNRALIYADIGEYDMAIKDYNSVINLDPEDAGAYSSRGEAYWHKGESDNAIADYSKAIELDPNDAVNYCKRCEVWLGLREWEKAKADLVFAKSKGYHPLSSFHPYYKNVADFEEKNGVTVPEDIKEMLTPA